MKKTLFLIVFSLSFAILFLINKNSNRVQKKEQALVENISPPLHSSPISNPTSPTSKTFSKQLKKVFHFKIFEELSDVEQEEIKEQKEKLKKLIKKDFPNFLNKLAKLDFKNALIQLFEKSYQGTIYSFETNEPLYNLSIKVDLYEGSQTIENLEIVVKNDWQHRRFSMDASQINQHNSGWPFKTIPNHPNHLAFQTQDDHYFHIIFYEEYALGLHYITEEKKVSQINYLILNPS